MSSSEPSLGTEARAAASSKASRISHDSLPFFFRGEGLDVLQDRLTERAGQEPAQLAEVQRFGPGEGAVEVEENSAKLHSFSRKETISDIRTGLAM